MTSSLLGACKPDGFLVAPLFTMQSAAQMRREAAQCPAAPEQRLAGTAKQCACQGDGWAAVRSQG
jgi:hypothetical protein